MSQPHPTPQKHHPLNTNPKLAVQKTEELTKRCACAVSHPPHFILSRFHTFPRYFTRTDTSCFHPKPSPKPATSAWRLKHHQLLHFTEVVDCRDQTSLSTNGPPPRSDGLQMKLASQHTWKWTMASRMHSEGFIAPCRRRVVVGSARC